MEPSLSSMQAESIADRQLLREFLLRQQDLRRVRSTGDLDRPAIPPRRLSGAQRRSDGLNRSEWSGRSPPLRSIYDTIPENALRLPEPALRADRPPPIPFEAFDLHLPPQTQEPQVDDANQRAARPPPRGWLGKVMIFFGQAGPNARVRSQLISLVWTLSSGLVQFIVIVALLAYSTHHESPKVQGVSEWDACQRPLGVWNAIWVVREAMTCLLAYWQWQRERDVRLKQERTRTADTEASNAETTNAGWDITSLGTTPRSTPLRRQPTTQELLAQLPRTPLYNRLSMLTSALTLVWFLTAHILEYTSVNTCRFAAPHLWWLTFGILCILYFMIVEIFLLGLLVFILGPVLFLFWNIVLLCIGRHPMQNPHQIRPDIGKLPKTTVDQIPLVLYIPPPPEGAKGKTSSPIMVPPSIHSYPPKKAAPSIHKRRFAFLRRSKKSEGADNEKSDASAKEKGKKRRAINTEPKTWEDHWVPGDYPFVRLEGNRAACAICLMDFEEPERVFKDGKDKDAKAVAGDETEGAAAGDVQEVQVDEITQADAARLKLEDAGDGAQPLRLLPCGHVYHKTCLDPWLLDVSGRCPVCQRQVELPDLQRKGKKDRRNNRRTP